MLEDKDIISVFKSRLDSYKKSREEVEKKWETLTNYYHLKHDKSYRFISFLSTYADAIRVRWVDSIFEGRECFGLMGYNASDDPNAINMQSVLKYQAEQSMNLIPQLKQAFIPLGYLGNHICAVMWDKANNSPKYIPFPLQDVFFDEADSIQKKKCIITRQKMTIGELKELETAGMLANVDQLISLTSTSQVPEDKSGYSVLNKSVGIKTDTIPADDKDTDPLKREVMVYQMWTDDQRITVDLKTETILSVYPHANPFAQRVKYKKPFVMFRVKPETGLSYSSSPVNSLIGLQEELNELRFDRRRVVDLLIKGIWLLRKGLNINKDRLFKYGFIEANSITENDLRRMVIENILPNIDREENNLMMYADRNTGVYDPQRGGGEGNVTKTARGLELLIKEGNLTFKEQIANIQGEGMKELVEQMIILNQENLDGGIAIRITGKQEATQITAEQLQGKFQYIVTSAPGLGMREIQQSGLNEYYATFRDDPDINQRVIKQKITRAYELDPDEVMLTQEQVDWRLQATQLQQMVAQLQQQLAKVAPAPTPETVTQPAPEKQMV